MTSDSTSNIHPFMLSWNIRNNSENISTQFSDSPCITGACLGEYPIDGWIKYFIEIPKYGKKSDITGRSNNTRPIEDKNVKWNNKRIINLPIYSNIDNYDLNQLEHVIEHWDKIGIPDDVPCLAIAIKCSGFYSEYREAQYVIVLTVWNDGISRITSLDWFEGPLDDCVTPEWYMNNTPLMNLNDAIEKMQQKYEHTSWDNPYFSIYIIPKCLGLDLKGTKSKAPYPQWDFEWKYANYNDFQSDLESILVNVQNFFIKVQQEDEINA